MKLPSSLLPCGLLGVLNYSKGCLIFHFLLINYIHCFKSLANFPTWLNETTTNGLIRLVAFDPVNENIYVGGVNNVFILDSNLNELSRLQTGPRWDNDNCLSSDSLSVKDSRKCASHTGDTLNTTDLINNENLALVVTVSSSGQRRLIICGTYRNGLCSYYSLSDSYEIRPINNAALNNSDRFSVSNDSTVLFIGPGPDKGRSSIWMGAYKRLNEISKYSSYLNVLGISVRTLLDGELQEQSEKVFKSSISEKAAFSCDYRAEFVSAFGDGGFSYFLARMPLSFTKKGFYATACSTRAITSSKIIQVCQSDSTLKSHVETTISCVSGGMEWTVLKAAALLQPGEALTRSYNSSKLREETSTNISDRKSFIAAIFGSKSSSSQSSHAICMYPISWVREIMLKNLRRCFSEAVGDTGEQFQNSMKCEPFTKVIEDSYCRADGCDELGGPLSGSIEMKVTSSFVTSIDDDVTAMSSSTVDTHTILFLGTSTGRLVKVVLDSFNNTDVNRAYKSGEISPGDNTAVQKDLPLSKDFMFLFPATRQKVYKLPVSECEAYLTCHECLSSLDPYCGWCALEGRCSLKLSCVANGFEDAWLSSVEAERNESSSCPSCRSISPYKLNFDDHIQNITFSLTKFPASKTKDSVYMCSFDLDPPVEISDVIATYSADQLACSVIDLQGLLAHLEEELVLNVKLFAIDKGRSRRPFLSIDYLVVTCSSLKNCTGCVGMDSGCVGMDPGCVGMYPQPVCGWCLSSNRCTKNGSCVYKKEQPLRDTDLCPKLLQQDENILAAGQNQPFELKAQNLPKSLMGSNLKYVCKFDGDPMEVPATYVSQTTVRCFLNPVTWSKKETKTAFLQLFWKDPRRNISIAIENLYNIVIFNCSSMSEEDDCSICKSFNLHESTRKFNCKWCPHGCSHLCVGEAQHDCPDPKIDKVTPLSGPMQGGTLVTLYGSNLALKRDLIRVFIDDIECSITSTHVGKNLTCRTKPSSRPKRNASMTIRVDGRGSVWSGVYFVYTDPQLKSIYPIYGPVSGSTMVTLHGSDLTFDDEHDFQVNIGPPCHVISILSNTSSVVCEKSPSSESYSSLPVEIPVHLKIDGANITNDKAKFQLRDNPIIFGIFPPSIFKSGGCTIYVNGSNLNASSSPSLKISTPNSREILIKPTIDNDTMMEFTFPRMQVGLTNLVFIFDHLRITRPFEITSDPEVTSFSKTILSKTQFLDLQGSNLLSGCAFDPVRITVGEYECKITEITNINILCVLPINISSSDEDKKLDINVTLGNLILTPGSVQLFNSRPKISHQGDNTIPIVVGSVVGSLIILGLVVGAIVVSRKISRSHKRNNILLKRIQGLEKTISIHCKQSFAELQTHVSGFSSEISDVGIPYWNFQIYAFKFLFPMLKDHDVLRVPKMGNCDNSYILRNEKLDQLNQLLNSKYFLLTFIRTLESQPKEFGIEDRSRLASWLTIILMNNLEYATIVMRELLDELIRKSIEKNAHKMMLRRTESVVEKLLSNWLCLTMFHYIKIEVGKCLFRLCKATEYQVDDGPVDAVTMESKFSLAEGKLLRVKVDPQTLNVTVLGSEPGHSGPVTCKMYDCDTVSQAKHKAIKALYKNNPYSSIPPSEDFQLRLKTSGNDNGLLLRDEDASTTRTNNWIQFNTLKHFNIKSGSTFFLILNHRPSHDHDNPSIWKNHGTMMIDSGSSLGTLKLSNAKTETKSFHLVRQDDIQNYYNGSEKLMSEVFLPRLLITKKALEDYIGQLFRSMMTCDSNLPPTVKFLYDFFDATAQRYNIIDPDVVHIWKSNSLPLRFWVSVMRNPDFVFDIEKSALVDPCLAVIAQVFIDGCSTHKQQLGFDSSSAKLLFANEMQAYKSQVDNFYTSIQRMPPVDWIYMNEFLHAVEKEAENKFNTEVALQEVLNYAVKFQAQIQESLDRDVACCNLKIPLRFHHMLS